MIAPSDLVELRMRDGHVTLEQSYAYCWFHPDNATVLYVGATWLHPAARAELHLHGDDPQVRIVGAGLEQAGIDANAPMRILAFLVPSQLNRQEAKMDLIGALANERLLSEHYFGPSPESPRQPDDASMSTWTATVIAFLRERSLQP